jgi:ParB-like chromosome segregation protein Spo0J
MSSQAENNRESPAPETVVMQPGKVKFRDIQTDAVTNSYRDSDELTDTSVAVLAEDMLAHGLITPWLVHELPDGKYMGYDCHRRYRAVECNIGRGAAGFSLDMEIPVHILPAATSELAVVKRAVSSNVQRSALPDVGKIRAAVRLKALGATDVEIGQTLAVSAATVGRLLTLGTNPVWMQYVSDHDITFSTAVRLLQAAEGAKRVKDLAAAFDQWRADTQAAVEAEDARRRANDETSLTISQKYLQSYLKGEQVDTWIDQLRSGRPLGPPAFRYKAQIHQGEGGRRLEIEAIDKDLDGLSFEALGKIAGRIADLNADLKKALREKHTAAKQGKVEDKAAEKERPSQQLWREFGLQALLEGEQAEETELAEEAEERRTAHQEQLARRAPEAANTPGPQAGSAEAAPGPAAAESASFASPPASVKVPAAEAPPASTPPKP